MSWVIELAIYATWAVVLARFQAVRDLVRRSPRRAILALTAGLVCWITVQLRDEQSRFYPLISYYMYGAWRPRPEILGGHVVGIECDGRKRPVSVLRVLRGYGLGNRIRRQYESFDRARSAADSAVRGARLDGLLEGVGRAFNQRNPEARLCGIRYEVVRLPAARDYPGVVPAPGTVRHVDLP